MTNPSTAALITTDPATLHDTLEELAAKHEDIISRIGGLFELLQIIAESNAELDGAAVYRTIAPHVEFIEQAATQAVYARTKVWEQLRAAAPAQPAISRPWESSSLNTPYQQPAMATEATAH